MVPVSSLLSLTWSLYKKNASVFLGYSAWILVPYIFIIIVEMLPLNTLLSDLLTSVFLIAQIAIIFWVTIAISIVTFSIIRKTKVKLSVLGRKAWTRVSPVILVALISLLITLGGFVLLIIPGLIFIIWYSFAQLEVILHKKRGWAALQESRRLVKGRFWPIAWRLVGGQVFLSLCYLFAIAIIIAIVSFILGTPEVALESTELPLWAEVLISIAEMVVLPLFVIYQTTLYLDVRSTFKK